MATKAIDYRYEPIPTLAEIGIDELEHWTDSPPPWDERLVVVFRLELDGFRIPFRKPVWSEHKSRKREYAALERRARTLEKVINALATNVSRQRNRVFEAVSALIETEYEGFARLARSDESLRKILDDCDRRGDTECPVTAGGCGLYLIVSYFQHPSV